MKGMTEGRQATLFLTGVEVFKSSVTPSAVCYVENNAANLIQCIGTRSEQRIPDHCRANMGRLG